MRLKKKNREIIHATDSNMSLGFPFHIRDSYLHRNIKVIDKSEFEVGSCCPFT